MNKLFSPEKRPNHINEGAPDINALFEGVKKIGRFDTDGLDEYNTQGFQNNIWNEGIKPQVVLDLYLEYLVKDTEKEQDFSLEEVDFYNAMRAWLHCDYDSAISFIKEKFDFECNDSVDFAKKYKFLNWVSMLIYNNMYIDEDVAGRTPIVANERSVFEELKKSLNKEGNSFLLNYFAKDFSDVQSGERDFVKGEAMDYKPFVIAPKIFALDRNSYFSMLSKNDLEDTLFVSKIENFEEINEILNGIGDNELMSQETFNTLVQYFSPIEIQGKDKKDIDVQLYRKLNEPYHREKIKEITKIDINELPINEQFYFLDYLKFADESKLNKIIQFNDNFHLTGLRTFLSLANGGREMGDKILVLGEKLPKELGEKVFSKYSEIVDSVSGVENNLLSWYQNIKIEQSVLEKLKEKLFKEGVSLLNNIYNDLETNNFEKEEGILVKLEEIKTNILILGSSYLELYKKNKQEVPPLEDILDMSVEQTKAILLTKETKEAIVKVYKNGRPKNTYENEDHLNLLVNEFTETLEREDTFVFNIMFKNEIIAFASFYKEDEDTLHIGGLTFLDGVRNPAIAEAVLFSIIKEFRKFNIKGLVDKKNPMLNMYIKRFGFKIHKDLPTEENAGEEYVEILREKES